MYDDTVALLYNFFNQIYSLSPLSPIRPFHSQLSFLISVLFSPLSPPHRSPFALSFSPMPLPMTHFLITPSLTTVVALVSWWVWGRGLWWWAVGGVGFASFLFFFFLVVVGLMSVGVVGLVHELWLSQWWVLQTTHNIILQTTHLCLSKNHCQSQGQLTMLTIDS